MRAQTCASAVNSPGSRYSPLELPVRPWPAAVVTLKDRTLSPAVKRFIDCAREIVCRTAAGKQAVKTSTTTIFIAPLLVVQGPVRVKPGKALIEQNISA